MKYSIVPDIINKFGIRFCDEHGVRVDLFPPYQNLDENFVLPFKPPFLVIDSFAKKTEHPPQIVHIPLQELKDIGFVITSYKVGNKRWFKQQGNIFCLEDIKRLRADATIFKHLPRFHYIQKDLANNRLRLKGKNAGYPHYNGYGPWVDIKKEGERNL